VPQLALVVAILAVSTAAPLVHMASAAPPLTVAAVRVCLAAVLLSIVSGPRLVKAFGDLDRRDRWLVAASGLLLGAHFGVWISSLYLTSTAASVALVATQPIFAGLFGWLLLREGVSRREIGGIAIAAVGCAVLASGDFGGDRDGALLGDMLAVLGATTAAGYFVLGRRLRASLPLIPYLAMVNIVAGLVLRRAFGPLTALVAMLLMALDPALILLGRVALAEGILLAASLAEMREIQLFFVGRPGRALIHDRDRAHTHIGEFLDPLTFIGFGRVDIAFRVG